MSLNDVRPWAISRGVSERMPIDEWVPCFAEKVTRWASEKGFSEGVQVAV
jgi:hypothetical protein